MNDEVSYKGVDFDCLLIRTNDGRWTIDKLMMMMMIAGPCEIMMMETYERARWLPLGWSTVRRAGPSQLASQREKNEGMNDEMNESRPNMNFWAILPGKEVGGERMGKGRGEDRRKK